MPDEADTLDHDLSDLSSQDWLNQLSVIAEANGMYQSLGPKHAASFIDHGDTLLVSFENIQGIQSLSKTAQPFGFDLVNKLGWSHLCLICDGDTWFRDENVYEFFDQLIDDGFFDEFEKIVFYGAGPCGYAAASYSVSAPGAVVIAIQPQATLDPDVTDWDDRFLEMRRLNFTDRYGYAPDMLDAASQAFVLYDPKETLDSMHATLFARANVERLKLPHFGGALQTRLIEMDALYKLISMAGTGELTRNSFFKLMRVRRSNRNYLRNLLRYLEHIDRPYLTMVLCLSVTQHRKMPRFLQSYQEMAKRAAAGEFTPPKSV